jgi:CDP-diacylglycerol---glycerol-3-phosphate 3-phosphatidyltransferase
MRINLPNQITLSRLVVAIVFFVVLAPYDVKTQAETWRLNWAAILFLIAAISDIADGYLARKHNQVTSFGRVLDPFVDKILVIGGYIFLASSGFVMADGTIISDVAPWMVVLILGRELLVTSLRGVQEGSGKAFGANLYGKIKMALQSTTIVWVLLTLAHPQGLAFFGQFNAILVYLTVVFTFLSMIPYMFTARSVLSQTSVPVS